MAKKQKEELPIITMGFNKIELSRLREKLRGSAFALDALLLEKIESAWRVLIAEEQRRRDILLHPKSCSGCKGQGANFDCAVRPQ